MPQAEFFIAEIHADAGLYCEDGWLPISPENFGNAFS